MNSGNGRDEMFALIEKLYEVGSIDIPDPNGEGVYTIHLGKSPRKRGPYVKFNGRPTRGIYRIGAGETRAQILLAAIFSGAPLHRIRCGYAIGNEAYLKPLKAPLRGEGNTASHPC